MKAKRKQLQDACEYVKSVDSCVKDIMRLAFNPFKGTTTGEKAGKGLVSVLAKMRRYKVRKDDPLYKGERFSSSLKNLSECEVDFSRNFIDVLNSLASNVSREFALEFCEVVEREFTYNVSDATEENRTCNKLILIAIGKFKK